MTANRLSPLVAARVLAVVRAPSAESALLGAEALVAGGVTGLEITFSTPDAPEVIRQLTERYGDDAYIGAGTVTSVDQARQAVEAGARFLVSPGTRPELTGIMLGTGAVVLTGALTPTEVMIAVELGVDVVKLFPAALSGPALLKALRGPFPDVPMMPTGGVTPDNLGEWLAAGAIAVGAGSDLISSADLVRGDYTGIQRKARAFAAAAAAAGGRA
ncbi:MAG: 2-dehydro-3-deoxyphosphogluconate aldolase [Naasia sp.]|jgi:2-dehydro-3-deoxyphosphogluconate aldolase/(4S)-4-hydroxy-2-oxoglutarate aldolase|uniref:bifunctional 4-hydroxy-2-oxoglutarate aldolase/2-dehydro-3-deoxy-phosphogluconate aldolase n=1 Tax=Naasia sp. TaxID=2546198 RepID=UPI002606033C|nr:bifunctional 4-hydroxy-2-oxoglutarate aldolase/2-dehydro-3-deoxy-phosphogluconate aldolase [Naasia sp.]MCU1571558.1 2-dehydro-3-deoxyphosphogluconate aldolase [Naasia sp.]